LTPRFSERFISNALRRDYRLFIINASVSPGLQVDSRPTIGGLGIAPGRGHLRRAGLPGHGREVFGKPIVYPFIYPPFFAQLCLPLTFFRLTSTSP
jgi:hypothetical protein